MGFWAGGSAARAAQVVCSFLSTPPHSPGPGAQAGSHSVSGGGCPFHAYMPGAEADALVAVA